MNRAAFGRKIRQLRIEKEYTQEQLSHLCETNPRYIYQVESGLRSVSLPVLIRLCNVLGTDPEYLLKDDLTTPAEQRNIHSELKKYVDILTPQEAELIKNIILDVLRFTGKK